MMIKMILNDKVNEKLFKSLAELLIEKPYEKIKVIDICKNANIPRSTFYYHFNDKNELLQFGIKKISGEITTEVMEIEADNFPDYADQLKNISLNYLKEYEDVYSALAKNDKEIVSLKIICNMIKEDIKEKIHNEYTDNGSDISIDFTIEFIIGGYENLARYWFKNNDRYSLDDVKNTLLVSKPFLVRIIKENLKEKNEKNSN